MPVSVSLSEEARIRLLDLCGVENGNQPLAVLIWNEPTAQLRRAPSGVSILERISGTGSVQVVPGGGNVRLESIISFQGVPFLRDVLPESTSFSLHIGVASGAFVIERHGT